MSTAHCDTTNSIIPHEVAVPAAARQPLQRLALVRRNQGISRRTLARRMNVDIEVVRQQERETADVSLSVLYAWQKALEVPLGELLTESGDSPKRRQKWAAMSDFSMGMKQAPRCAECPSSWRFRQPRSSGGRKEMKNEE